MPWLPDWLHEKQKRERERVLGKMGKGGKGKGKCKGKGKNGLDKDYSKRVWIGGLPEGVGWKLLQEHMNQAGKTTWIEVFSGRGAGTAGVSYATSEEALAAIQNLN